MCQWSTSNLSSSYNALIRGVEGRKLCQDSSSSKRAAACAKCRGLFHLWANPITSQELISPGTEEVALAALASLAGSWLLCLPGPHTAALCWGAMPWLLGLNIRRWCHWASGQPSKLPTVVLCPSGISSETQHCHLLEGQEFGPFRDM